MYKGKIYNKEYGFKIISSGRKILKGEMLENIIKQTSDYKQFQEENHLKNCIEFEKMAYGNYKARGLSWETK